MLQDRGKEKKKKKREDKKKGKDDSLLIKRYCSRTEIITPIKVPVYRNC